MDKYHAACKQCVAHHYWHHMDDQKCFFKIMMGDCRIRMVIPKFFATNVRGQISEEVKLKVPNGRTYDVKVAKEQNDLVIGAGWATFASAYDLNPGDFLVFTYSGHSPFNVQILDPSGCEKDYSCVLMDCIPCVQERSASQGNHMQSPTMERLAKRCIGSSSQCRKTTKTSPTESPSQKTIKDVPYSEGIQETMNSSGFQKSTKCCFVLPAGYNMSNEQKARVDALVRKIRPQIPLYVTAMDKTTVTGGFLAMAKDFALIHLLDESGTIKLSQLDCSKTWTISLEVNTNNPCALSTGWMDFIQDNKLQEGDICVFQPSKSKNGVALIFHPLEESRCSQPPAGYVPSAKSPRHGLYKPPYYLSRFTALNDQQKNKIDKKVRAIQSDIPPYVAVMQHSNISHNVCILHFGSEYATTCFPRESQSMMLQCRSKDNTW